MTVSIRKGTLSDCEDYIRLLYTVRETMPNRDWFFLDSPEEIRQMMASGMMQLWLAEDQGKMAAGFDYFVPGLEDFNYGYDLDFTREALLRVVQMDTAAVYPEYRGMGLQNRLMAAAEGEISREPGRILLCTVHPDNRFSLENVMKQGYSIGTKVEKYDSVRYVMRKDLP